MNWRKLILVSASLAGLALLAVAFPIVSWGCFYVPKPKIVVEGNDPAVSFYASVLALGKLQYRILSADTGARTLVTEPRTGDDFWWQVSIIVAGNGHVSVDTKTNLERQEKGKTVTHEGIVDRAKRVSEAIQEIIYENKAEKIIEDGTALLPALLVVPEEPPAAAPAGEGEAPAAETEAK